MTGAAKSGNQQTTLLDMLGMGNNNNIPPQYGAGANLPWQQSAQDPQSILAQYQPQPQQPPAQSDDFATKLARWGAGVSKASGATYGPPKTFGEVLAGGQDSLDQGAKAALEGQKTQAEIGALGQKGKPDFNETAQNALIKRNLGIPLTPQDEATLKAWDSINQTKSSFGTDAMGNLRMTPRASILGTGGANVQPQGGGQAPRTGLPPGITPDKLEEYKRLRGLQ